MEFRNLTAEMRARFLAEGYRWIVFRVGDKILLIDLTRLETEGEYIFALDPLCEGAIVPEEDGTAMAAAWYEGERINLWDGEGVLTEVAEEMEPAAVLLDITEEIPQENAAAA